MNGRRPPPTRFIPVLLLLAARAAALEQEAPAIAALPASASHWSKQGASLVLYDSSDTIVTEIPLASSEEPSSTGLRATLTTGGTSTDGRFAWTLEKTTAWNASKTKALSEERLLRYLGTTGRELWSLAGADASRRSDPVAMSDTGEVAAVSVLGKDGWTVSIRNSMGGTLWETTGIRTLLSVSLTPGGRYALIRWAEPDRSATHTFVEVATGARKDAPSDEFVLGGGRVDEDGKVYAGTKLIHDFKQKAAP